MATTIIAEDGTFVSGANSYVSTEDAVAYAALRGVTIDNTADVADRLVYKSMDVLETMMYQGIRTSAVNQLTWPTTQLLEWPRDCVYIEDLLLDKNTIPQQLINAQCELITALSLGYDPLMVITLEAGIIHKKFGPFEIGYSNNTPIVPILQKVDKWLSPLLESGANNGIHFSIERSYG